MILIKRNTHNRTIGKRALLLLSLLPSFTFADQPTLHNEQILLNPESNIEASVSAVETSRKKNAKVKSVAPSTTDKHTVQADLNSITLIGADQVYEHIKLPHEVPNGSIIRWSSSDKTYMDNHGKVVKMAEKGKGMKSITMRATAYKGDASASKEFTVNVAEDEGYVAYLFSYFTGNSPMDEQIKLALSVDGYNYTPLNNGAPIISSQTIAKKGAVRDPHILRGEDGHFYMVVTDMRSEQGWASNDGLVLLRSSNLIDWTHKSIDFPDTWPYRFDRDELTQVWAPQTIFDPQEGKYMVYYSIGERGKHYITYYSYANADFTELTEPEVLYDHGANTIDGDIVYKDGLFHLFFKTEGQGNGIQKATASSLKGPWTPHKKYLQQTDVAVEGSGVFKKINSNEWILMYDCYGNGYYQFCSSTDLVNFDWICNSTTSADFGPRHGTTIPITQQEMDRLLAKWPSTAFSTLPKGAKNPNVRQAMFEADADARKVFIPVYHGTNIQHFDPQLYADPGMVITPTGPQDFSKGAIEYKITNGDTATATSYSVAVEMRANPVLPDFHADPEIMYAHKTGRFYIYSTTDGFPGWGGYSFNVFSSVDMVNWEDEGTMLDLSTDQVSWATGNAWAPCIIEKKIGDDYKYFYYFSGHSENTKKIGVASSSSPIGPFIDHGTPIIDQSPTGGGQQIDVDVFCDPVTGRDYIYWGNGYMAGAELETDMATLKPGTTTVMTPPGGTLADYAFREAPYVFYRNGLYYFLWSVDDTGSANYHIAYGTSTSPLGELKVADQPIVIIQDPSQQIYGTGHNAVINVPGTDDWYIVYHRINKNKINNHPGIHREVCIDPFSFDASGNIIQAVPTHKGIEPVFVSPALKQ